MVVTPDRDADSQRAFKDLESFFETAPPLAVAYSGGLDSRFLCHAALAAGVDVLAVHVSGPHIASADTEYALRWAAQRGLPLVLLEIDPLALPDVANNTRQRCYACKNALFAAIKSGLARLGEERRALCDGGNLDDACTYRPGSRAAREAGAVSPLAESGLGKDDLRRLALATGLDNAAQKPRPCLLTRLAYGVRPEVRLLRSIARAEKEIGALLLKENLSQCDFRLRLLPVPELHLNADCRDLADSLAEIMAKYGFSGGKIRQMERLSGFFDRPER